MPKTISELGLRFIEKWEEKVPYVYDDKVPKRRINGHLQYPEWDGSDVVGTLTIGYGHTDAAGYPKIKQDMRFTDEQCDEVLTADLRPCISCVNRSKLPFTQHQADAMYSFTFNCGQGNFSKLTRGLTADNYEEVIPRRLLQYVTSKGERMRGLVNRRAGEIQLWNTHDDLDEDDASPSPAGERADKPKPVIESKSANASILTGGAGAGVSLTAISDATSSIKDVKGNVSDLGLWDFIGHAAHTPFFWIGIAVVVLGGFIYWDRSRKLEEEHI